MSIQKNVERAFTELITGYVMIRKRIVQEGTLIYERSSLLLWANAILIAFYATLANGLVESAGHGLMSHLSAVPVVVTILGIVSNLGGLLSILAGQWEIEFLRTLFEALYPGAQESEAGGLVLSVVGHRNHHLLGKIEPVLLPVAFGILWVTLGVLEF